MTGPDPVVFGPGPPPPHIERVRSGRFESTEKVAGIPLYELDYDMDYYRSGRPWRLTARAHGRHSTTRHRTPGDARKAAQDDYAKGPGDG